MPDGTRTSVHLFRFGPVGHAEAYKDTAVQADDVEVPDTSLCAFREKKPHGPEQTRWACIQAGDVLAVVTRTRPGGALLVPSQQTVALRTDCSADRPPRDPPHRVGRTPGH